MLRVQALGTAEIRARDLRVEPSSPRKFALLLRLAADPGRRIPRSVLRELIFPDLLEKNARHSLRDLVYQFRQAGMGLESDAGGLTLLDEASSDFNDLISAEQPTAEQLQAAQDGFLPAYAPGHSEAFSEWLEVFRARVTLDMCRSISRAINRAKTVGDWDMTERAARACLALDPSHEEATLALAETLAVSGSKARAFDLLDEYSREVGTRQPAFEVPVRVARRRISERISERPQSGLFLPFTGRDQEMLALNERFTLARDGQAQCVAITGDAGIGKSRLAEEFCTSAALRGARVERIATQPHDTHRPMATFADLVPRLLKLPGSLGCSPESMAAIRKLTTHTDPPQEPDGRLHETIAADISRAIADLIDAVAAESLLVVFVDDIQWLDERSRAILGSLASAKIRRRLVVLLTSRDRAEQSFFGRRAENLLALNLKPLSEDSVAALIERVEQAPGLLRDAELRAWMVDTSGGNPFYLRSLLNHHQTTQERFAVPATLSALLDQQLVSLGPDALSVLSMCVVLGRHSDIAHLVLSLEIPHVQLHGAIRELESRCLLAANAERIEPAHWLIAEAVDRNASPIARRLLHRRVADILEREAADTRSTATYWDCAEHWTLADDRQRACAAMETCADYSLEIGRPREAAEVLLRAAAFVDGGERARFLMRALQLADSVGEPEILLRGFDLARRSAIELNDDELEIGAVVARLSVRDDTQSAAQTLRKWLHPQIPLRQRTRAATTLLYLADQDSKPELAREAYGSMEAEIGEPRVESIPILVFLMVYHSRFADIAYSVEIAERLLLLSETLGTVESLDVQRKSAVAFYRAGHFRRAANILHEALARAKALQSLRSQYNILNLLVGVHSDLNEDEESAKWLATFNELAAESEEVQCSLSSICSNVEAACLVGDVGSARRWLELGRPHVSKVPTARATRFFRALTRWTDQLDGIFADAATTVSEMTSHHLVAFEPGDLSDLEVFVAVNALAHENSHGTAHGLLGQYLSKYRRFRRPGTRSLQEAARLVAWPEPLDEPENRPIRQHLPSVVA